MYRSCTLLRRLMRSCLHLCSFCRENACVQCMCKHRMRTYMMLNNVHKKMTTTLISMNQTGSVELLCIHNYIPVDLVEARLPSPVFCTGVDVLCATLCRPSPTLLTFPKKKHKLNKCYLSAPTTAHRRNTGACILV